MPTQVDGSQVNLQLRRADVTFTDAQIKALPTTPLEVVAAPGAGRYVEMHSCFLIQNFTDAYQNVGEFAYLTLSYGSTPGDFSKIPNLSPPQLLTTFFERAVPTRTYLTQLGGEIENNGVFYSATAIGNAENQPLNLYVDNDGGGNLTGTTTGSTLRVIVNYSVEDVS